MQDNGICELVFSFEALIIAKALESTKEKYNFNNFQIKKTLFGQFSERSFFVVNLWKQLNVEYGKIVSKKNKGVLIVKKAVQKIIDVFRIWLSYAVVSFA